MNNITHNFLIICFSCFVLRDKIVCIVLLLTSACVLLYDSLNRKEMVMFIRNYFIVVCFKQFLVRQLRPVGIEGTLNCKNNTY